MKFRKSLIIIFIIIAISAVFFAIWPKKQKEKPLPEKNLPKIMKILSPAFKNNSKIPEKYTCDGENINPPLEIKDIPENAESLVLIVDDPDAPGKTFLHWLVFNIDPGLTSIAENTIPKGGVQGKNNFGKENYGGPCPPFGQHRYFFKVYALDKKLDLAEGASLKAVKTAMENHILDQGQLMGLYQRNK